MDRHLGKLSVCLARSDSRHCAECKRESLLKRMLVSRVNLASDFYHIHKIYPPGVCPNCNPKEFADMRARWATERPVPTPVYARPATPLAMNNDNSLGLRATLNEMNAGPSGRMRSPLLRTALDFVREEEDDEDEDEMMEEVSVDPAIMSGSSAFDPLDAYDSDLASLGYTSLLGRKSTRRQGKQKTLDVELDLMRTEFGFDYPPSPSGLSKSLQCPDAPALKDMDDFDELSEESSSSDEDPWFADMDTDYDMDTDDEGDLIRKVEEVQVNACELERMMCVDDK